MAVATRVTAGHDLSLPQGKRPGENLVREEPQEGQLWGRVQDVQGEARHLPNGHPLRCCPCELSQARDLLLSCVPKGDWYREDTDAGPRT